MPAASPVGTGKRIGETPANCRGFSFGERLPQHVAKFESGLLRILASRDYAACRQADILTP